MGLEKRSLFSGGAITPMAFHISLQGDKSDIECDYPEGIHSKDYEVCLKSFKCI